MLKGAAASTAAMLPLAEALGAQSAGLQFDPPVPFTYELFKAEARGRAHAPYVPRSRPAQEVLQKINYEEWGKIRYRDDYALFANGPGRFPVTFFHLGLFSRKRSACMSSRATSAPDRLRPVLLRHARQFPCAKVPKGVGFAGLRIQEARDGTLDWHKNDWVAFLGAAYFARSASSRNTAYRLAASRLTSRLPIVRKSFPTSRNSTSRPQLETRSHSTR